MPIPITCEYCEESYRITDKAAGKRIRCKECGEAIDVPGRATTRSASRTSRAANSRSRSGATSSRSSKPARSRNEQRPAKSRSHISNRRERQNDDDQTKNLIMGICIAAISIIGGGAFLVFGRGDSTANKLAQADFESQREAERERREQETAAFNRNSREQARRIVEEGKRMTDGLNDFSSDMGRPDMTPPNLTSPGMESPNTTIPGMPPGIRPPSYTPPTSGRPGFTGPGSTTPPGFEPPNFGGRSGNRPGTNFGRSRSGDVPRSAESDADLAALEQVMKSGDISSRIRATSTLSRSSRKAEAARILAENITERDESTIVNRLGGMGEAAEPHLLKLLQTIPLDQFSRAVPILSALGRCGTQKSIPVLEEIANSRSPAAGMASISISRIQSKR